MAELKVLLYGKQGCGKCQAAKKKLGFFLDKWGYNGSVEFGYRDLETEDGLAEAAMNDVLFDSMPTVLIEHRGRGLARWDGRAPESQELRLCIESAIGAPRTADAQAP
jgi:glutaredoxin